MTAESFVQCVLGVLEKIEKSRDLANFLSNFGLISAVSYIPILYWQTHTFNAIAHIGL